MQDLTADCLEDDRVFLIEDDVAMLIDAAEEGYDAILLDVDNGPDGLTRRINDRLYSRDGLRSAMRALKPHGILAIWSAEPDYNFVERLHQADFDVSEVRVRERSNGRGARHVIWFAQKGKAPATA